MLCIASLPTGNLAVCAAIFSRLTTKKASQFRITNPLLGNAYAWCCAQRNSLFISNMVIWNTWTYQVFNNWLSYQSSHILGYWSMWGNSFEVQAGLRRIGYLIFKRAAWLIWKILKQENGNWNDYQDNSLSMLDLGLGYGLHCRDCFRWLGANQEPCHQQPLCRLDLQWERDKGPIKRHIYRVTAIKRTIHKNEKSQRTFSRVWLNQTMHVNICNHL